MLATTSAVLLVVLVATMFMLSGFSELSVAKKIAKVAVKNTSQVEHAPITFDVATAERVISEQLERLARYAKQGQKQDPSDSAISLPDNLNGWSDSIDTLTQYLANLISQLQTAISTVSQLNDDNAWLNGQLEYANSNINDLTSQLASAQSAIDGLTQQLTDAQSSLAAAQSAIETLTSANAALSSQIDALTNPQQQQASSTTSTATFVVTATVTGTSTPDVTATSRKNVKGSRQAAPQIPQTQTSQTQTTQTKPKLLKPNLLKHKTPKPKTPNHRIPKYNLKSWRKSTKSSVQN